MQIFALLAYIHRGNRVLTKFHAALGVEKARPEIEENRFG
jgi:hypothetical protein